MIRLSDQRHKDCEEISGSVIITFHSMGNSFFNQQCAGYTQSATLSASYERSVSYCFIVLLSHTHQFIHTFTVTTCLFDENHIFMTF